MTSYPEKIARLLRESGEREAAKRREGIRTATKCGWCGKPTPPGTTCCGNDPWKIPA